MSLLDPERFRLMRLEDGEQVVRLHGPALGDHKSDGPHAGLWGQDVGYVLVPCRSIRQVNQRVTVLGALDRISNRSSDAEVLLVGPEEDILRFVTQGPSWCRAMSRRRQSEETKAKLAASGHLFRKQPRSGSEPQDATGKNGTET